MAALLLVLLQTAESQRDCETDFLYGSRELKLIFPLWKNRTGRIFVNLLCEVLPRPVNSNANLLELIEEKEKETL